MSDSPLSKAVTDAMAALTADLRILEPSERIRAGAQMLMALQQAQAAVAAERKRAARELRGSGWTFRRIGDACGFTAQQAYKLTTNRKETTAA